MAFLPISLNITGKKILIVGGGRVAAHKLKFLVPFTTNITVIAPDVLPEIYDFGLTVVNKEFEDSDVEGFYVVYSCTNIGTLNAHVKAVANRQNILVCVVDNPPLCDFVSPAIFKDGNMTVAVGSNAQEVRRSIEWRNKIRDFLQQQPPNTSA